MSITLIKCLPKKYIIKKIDNFIFLFFYSNDFYCEHNKKTTDSLITDIFSLGKNIYNSIQSQIFDINEFPKYTVPSFLNHLTPFNVDSIISYSDDYIKYIEQFIKDYGLPECGSYFIEANLEKEYNGEEPNKININNLIYVSIALYLIHVCRFSSKPQKLFNYKRKQKITEEHISYITKELIRYIERDKTTTNPSNGYNTKPDFNITINNDFSITKKITNLLSWVLNYYTDNLYLFDTKIKTCKQCTMPIEEDNNLHYCHSCLDKEKDHKLELNQHRYNDKKISKEAYENNIKDIELLCTNELAKSISSRLSTARGREKNKLENNNS